MGSIPTEATIRNKPVGYTNGLFFTCAVCLIAAFAARFLVLDYAAFRISSRRLVNQHRLIDLIMVDNLGMGFHADRRAAVAGARGALRGCIRHALCRGINLTRFAADSTGIAIVPNHAAIRRDSCANGTNKQN